MDIIICNKSTKPIYEQITSQFKEMIMNGVLKPGDSLPSMRALAKSLHISVITAQKSYDDLRRDGFIDTAVGRGSFVAVQNNELIREEQQRKIDMHLEEAAQLAKTHGITFENLIEALKIFYFKEED